MIDGLFAFNNVKRLRSGGSAPALKMAEDLGPRVTYGMTVARVQQDNNSVEVVAASGERWRAKYAVLTGAPSVLKRLKFEPPLPKLKEQVLQSVPMGNAVRFSAVYPWPWWRSRGLSGAWGDELTGSLLPLGMDMTPCDPSRATDCDGAPGIIQVHPCPRSTHACCAWCRRCVHVCPPHPLFTNRQRLPGPLFAAG